ILGGVAPALGVAGWVALRASRRTAVVTSAVLALGYVLVAYVPRRLAPDAGLDAPLFGTVGVLVVGILLVVLWRLWGPKVSGAGVFKEAMEAAARRIRREDPDATIWSAGHWGMQFYAEREGMKPLVARPARRTAHPVVPSPLRKGDWIVMEDQQDPERISQQG